MAALISRYKQVRDDMAEASPVVTGLVSGSPEIHEKIANNGRGAVVLFATAPGTYDYTTKRAVTSEHWSNGAVSVEAVKNRGAHMTATFSQPGAHIVYFGVGH